MAADLWTKLSWPWRVRRVGYIPRWFTCPQTVTHPSRNHTVSQKNILDIFDCDIKEELSDFNILQ